MRTEGPLQPADGLGVSSIRLRCEVFHRSLCPGASGPAGVGAQAALSHALHVGKVSPSDRGCSRPPTAPGRSDLVSPAPASDTVLFGSQPPSPGCSAWSWNPRLCGHGAPLPGKGMSPLPVVTPPSSLPVTWELAALARPRPCRPGTEQSPLPRDGAPQGTVPPESAHRTHLRMGEAGIGFRSQTGDLPRGCGTI